MKETETIIKTEIHALLVLLHFLLLVIIIESETEQEKSYINKRIFSSKLSSDYIFSFFDKKSLDWCISENPVIDETFTRFFFNHLIIINIVIFLGS